MSRAIERRVSRAWRSAPRWSFVLTAFTLWTQPHGDHQAIIRRPRLRRACRARNAERSGRNGTRTAVPPPAAAPPCLPSTERPRQGRAPRRRRLRRACRARNAERSGRNGTRHSQATSPAGGGSAVPAEHGTPGEAGGTTLSGHVPRPQAAPPCLPSTRRGANREERRRRRLRRACRARNAGRSGRNGTRRPRRWAAMVESLPREHGSTAADGRPGPSAALGPEKRAWQASSGRAASGRAAERPSDRAGDRRAGLGASTRGRQALRLRDVGKSRGARAALAPPPRRPPRRPRARTAPSRCVVVRVVARSGGPP